jgi:hypothetical protein
VLGPQISVENCLVSGASAEEAAVPSDCAYPAFVTGEGLEHLAFDCVPDLQNSRVCAHSQHVSSVAPLDAGYGVVGAQVVELSDLAGSGGPQIDAGAESYR